MGSVKRKNVVVSALLSSRLSVWSALLSHGMDGMVWYNHDMVRVTGYGWVETLDGGGGGYYVWYGNSYIYIYVYVYGRL